MKETRKSINKKTHTSFRITTWAYTAIVTALVLVFTYAVWFSFAVVSDDGMMPTLKSGDVLLCSRLEKYFGGIKRGDVLVFYDNNGNKVLGRVVALENETVEIRDNKTYINGILFDEESYSTGTISDVEKITVPDGVVFILPDDRNSTPLLDFTLIPFDSIKATAVLRLFPFSRIGVFA
ncbi:MAG: signal peptidase I [Clostridia bacterium]|nr:signal peptidase I [Clostridia bacterium]